MKKLLLSIVLSLGLLFTSACGSTTAQDEPNIVDIQEQQATIEVVDSEGDSFSSDVDFEDGDVLLDALVEYFEVDETDGFINGINDVVADADNKEFLAIYVNEEMAMVGAAELELSDGDYVQLIIETWE